MANQLFAGFAYNNVGDAIVAADVYLYDRNTTTPIRAQTTTDANGYWTISHATEGRFDVEIVSGTTKRRRKYDDSVQLETIEAAVIRQRNPADTFDYTFTAAAIVADRILNWPLLTGTGTVAVLEDVVAGGQTFAGAMTFSLAGAAVAITGATGNTLVVDTNVLVVDATNNRVGQGLTAPLTAHHIKYLETQVRLETTGTIGAANTALVSFYDSAGIAGYVGYGGNPNVLEVFVTVNQPISFATNNLQRMRILANGDIVLGGIAIGAGTVFYTAAGGVQIGQPTGGDKGAGTLNAVGVYDDNVLLTDYVFEDGYKLPSIPEMAAFFTARKHLPTIPGRAEWEKSGSFSVGQIATRLWETVEAQAIYITQLHNRLIAIGA